MSHNVMGKSVTVPWAFDTPPELEFDGRCVCCGKPTTDTFPLKITHTAQPAGDFNEATIVMPLCGQCGKEDTRNGLISFGTFFLAGGLAAIALFVLTIAGMDRFTPLLGIDETTANRFAWAVALLVGLVGGCTVGLCAEFLAKLVLLPFLGRAFRFAPLLAVELLTRASYKAGVISRLSKAGDALQLSFMNTEVAAAFAQRNSRWILEATP
jgi:hypothetical protein